MDFRVERVARKDSQYIVYKIRSTPFVSMGLWNTAPCKLFATLGCVHDRTIGDRDRLHSRPAILYKVGPLLAISVVAAFRARVCAITVPTFDTIGISLGIGIILQAAVILRIVTRVSNLC